MATYVEGQRYLRNRITGAVFQHRDRLIGLKDLEEYTADADGNLVKVEARPVATEKLNPTKTPEKKATAPAKTATPTPARPTLNPADKK